MVMRDAKTGRKRRYPEPTVPEPSFEELEEWMWDLGEVQATDGCEGIEPDGECVHGHVSWLRYLGIL
jgi:hypothetical protein